MLLQHPAVLLLVLATSLAAETSQSAPATTAPSTTQPSTSQPSTAPQANSIQPAAPQDGAPQATPQPPTLPSPSQDLLDDISTSPIDAARAIADAFDPATSALTLLAAAKNGQQANAAKTLYELAMLDQDAFTDTVSTAAATALRNSERDRLALVVLVVKAFKLAQADGDVRPMALGLADWLNLANQQDPTNRVGHLQEVCGRVVGV